MTGKNTNTVSISPTGGLALLSQQEVAALRQAGHGGMHDLLRKCALAVLNTGSEQDDARAVLETYEDFKIEVIQQDRGIKLELTNAPNNAFVDGKIIEGVRELLFDVLRDIVYVHTHLQPADDGGIGETQTTDFVFSILRNAEILRTGTDPKLVVCWGGHSISREEYDYTKEVGYAMGLRGLNICTGCGPGAMKGPMKGATIAHSKQRIEDGDYIGISEPGIIAAESPNPIVNRLVIMPDIEKRLEAFVRVGHGIVVFPGGVGTAEEILYLLGILMHPKNENMPFPLVFTGPAESADYFEQIDEFLQFALGDEATKRYQIIVEDPDAVARVMAAGMDDVRAYRRETKDAFFFNWGLTIRPEFQEPFIPSHDNMAALQLERDRPPHKLAADLRRAFSGIVAGNVKEEGIARIAARGKFELQGDAEIMERMDALLQRFVSQHRMKLPGTRYEPCYVIKK